MDQFRNWGTDGKFPVLASANELPRIVTPGRGMRNVNYNQGSKATHVGQSNRKRPVCPPGFLMSNHVHLIVVPRRIESLAVALKNAHGRYAAYWNAAQQSSGHVWQGRFYSCPLDDAHLWIALRYTERNPVRARLVDKAESWGWSSAAAHCGVTEVDPGLDLSLWAKRWSSETWREYLNSGENEAELRGIRKCTHSGRPLGSQGFVHSLEQLPRGG